MRPEELPEEDFNLVDLLKTIRQEVNILISLIRKHLKLFIIIHILLLIGSYFFFKSIKPKYDATRTFIIENGSASGLGALSGFTSLFGINKPGEGNEKYMELLSSPNYITKVLLRTYKGGDQKTIIEHYLTLNKKKKNWSESSDSTLNVISTVDFSGKKNNALEKIKRSIAVQLIADEILQGKSYSYNYDKKTGVFSIGFKSTNEEFSLEFLNAAYEEFKTLIYNDLFEQSNENLQITKSKLDSIYRELKRNTYAYANKSDRTLGLILQEDNVPKNENLMKMNTLAAVYGEALKQYETFKFVNQSEKINFLVISEPILPILPEKVKWKLYMAILQVLAFFGILFGVRFRYYLKKVLN